MGGAVFTPKRRLMLTFPLGVFFRAWGSRIWGRRNKGILKGAENYLTGHTGFFSRPACGGSKGRRNKIILKKAKNNLTDRARRFSRSGFGGLRPKEQNSKETDGETERRRQRERKKG